MIDTIIHRLENRHILILGFGREGKSTLNFILAHKIPCRITIADKQAPDKNQLAELALAGIECLFGEDYLSWKSDFDLIIKTPGIPSSLITQDLHYRVTSQTDLFLEAFGHQTIGITGTKGKSTTSSLIHHLLVRSGIHSLLTGNIGIPCFDIVPEIKKETKIVFELSAHQLEFIRHSPHVGLLLNIFPEHLDHFDDFDHYAAAKCNIFKYLQFGDTLIIHSDLKHYLPRNFEAEFILYDTHHAKIPTMPLRGKHFENLVRAALIVAAKLEIDEEVALKALCTFTPLPHRLEPIGPVDGVMFINDSIATVPEASLAAIEAWPPTFLILGGYDRGIDYSLITKGIQHHEIPFILLTGPAGQRMGALIEAAFAGKITFYFDKLEEAFEFVAANAKEGNLVLLSPAAASYDSYRNFEHRGDRFRELARQFKRKTPSTGLRGE